MKITQRITPFLWFNDNAEEAANFYISIFPNSKILNIVRRPAGVPGPEGAAMVVAFSLDGCSFTALNGGPQFTFGEAVSFVIACDTQQEIDHYWDTLTGGGGKPVQCGWLKDKFGLSWQVVPSSLPELLGNPATTGRVMEVIMQMVKLDIAKMQAAAKGA